MNLADDRRLNDAVVPNSDNTPESEVEREESGVVERSRLAVQLSVNDEKRLSAEEKSQLIDFFSGSRWTPALREFALHFLVPDEVNAVLLENLRERLAFIEGHIPSDALESCRKSFAHSVSAEPLLKARLSYLEAISQLVGQNGWRQILDDPALMKKLERAALYGDPLYALPDGLFPGFSQRFSLPVEADEESEGRRQELEDVLQQSGLSELTLPLVRTVKVTAHRSNNGMAGQFHRKSGDLTVSTAAESKEFLVPALLHELGHAFEDQLTRDPEALEIFDRYIVLTQTENIQHSPYADSFDLASGRADHMYIREAFAEDFRLFWLKPEDLSFAKRAVFDALLDRLMLPLGADEIRGRLRQVLGNYYGASVDRLLQDIDCFDAETMLRQRKIDQQAS